MSLPHLSLLFFLLIAARCISAAQGLAVVAPHILSYTALGDSYASGNGAGSSKLLPNLDITCGRFSDAYPVQIASNFSPKIPGSGFHNLACGGASTTSILHSQVLWTKDSDIVTLTVGGNEVDFFAIVNECIYEWHPFSTCDKELTRSRTLTQSNELLESYGKMIKEILRKLKPGARLLVTGYASFFNSVTDNCNHVSFSKSNPGSKLTKELRVMLNDLVTMLNNVIEMTCKVHGAEYVNINQAFEGHRFCEEGVDEPDEQRNETWFFTSGQHEAKGVSDSLPLGQHTISHSPFKEVLDFTRFARTFHPTSRGHKAIAEQLVAQILLGPDLGDADTNNKLTQQAIIARTQVADA